MSRSAHILLLLTIVAGATACSHDPSGPPSPGPALAAGSSGSEKAAVCHLPGAGARILEISANALPDHLGHGDYLARLVVDPGNPAVGDGLHFGRITDALEAARAVRLAQGELQSAGCRITIAVAAGVFRGTAAETTDPSLERFPLVVDVPDITLRGAFSMALDAGGRAAGHGADALASTFAPVDPLPIVAVACAGGLCSASTPIIIANGHPGGSAGNGLEVEGFVFRSGYDGVDEHAAGQGVFAMRVAGLVIQGNRFEAGFTESIDLRATSAVVARNHLGGGGGTCDICLAGPGVFQVVGNRLLAGGIPGILSAPVLLLPVPVSVEQYELPAASEITADVTNNEVRDHLRIPVGAGVRVTTVGRGAPDVRGTSHVSIHDNTLLNNNFAVLIEAAFPVRNTALRGDADVTLGRNVMRQSCQANLLVAFTRHTTALGLTNQPYLQNSTYTVALGGDVAWDDVWFSHPADLGNRLTVDGTDIPTGAHAAYDAGRSCTP